MTARNGPAHDPGFPAVETPVATGNPSSAIPARAQSRCPRSSPPGACGNSAPAAPKAPPAWPRNRTDRPPRQSRRNRPRSVPTADGRKTLDPASAASPPSYHQVPLTILLLSHRHQRIPRSNQNVKESDQAACVQCRLRQRAVNVSDCSPAKILEAAECILDQVPVARRKATEEKLTTSAERLSRCCCTTVLLHSALPGSLSPSTLSSRAKGLTQEMLAGTYYCHDSLSHRERVGVRG